MGWKDELTKEEKIPVADVKPIEEEVDKVIQNRKEEPIVKETFEEPPKKIKTKKQIKRGKGYYDMTGIVTGLFIAMVLLLLISAYIYMPDPEMGTIYFIVVIVVGMVAWMPIGIPIGAILIDTYLRCKLLRIMTKKNYGIIHIVSKGQRIVTMIKDLDESIIMKGEAIWGISKGYIYNINKKNHKLPLLPKHINYMSNVPTLYLDYETMKPLSFHSEKTEISPKQLGSSLVGWAMVQKKKAIRQQKQVNIMYLIIMILIIVNMALTAQVFMILSGVTS